MHDELGGVNPADLVRRCARKRCDKSFQGSMPDGWERLRPDVRRRLAKRVTASEGHTVLCPKHAQELDVAR
jgi:hypothetical protein